MKTKLITIISVLVVIAGLAILAYPIISNMMFQKSQQELIDFYDSQINEIPEKTANITAVSLTARFSLQTHLMRMLFKLKSIRMWIC